MTKIKNTKKGMAKKTLSMSLVVAMLATSNVPVWAAEFSDGTDAAVATETPAVEAFSDNAADAPVVENDENTVAAQDTNTSVTANVTFKGADSNNTVDWSKSGDKKLEADISSVKVNGIELNASLDAMTEKYVLTYAWKVNGVAETENEVEVDPDGYEIDPYAPSASDAGKTISLILMLKEEGSTPNDVKTIWSQEFGSFTVNYRQISDYVKINKDKITNPGYDGKEHKEAVSDALLMLTDGTSDGYLTNESNYDVAYSGKDYVNVTEDGITVTLTPNADKLPGYAGSISYTYKISPKKLSSYSGDMVATIVNTSYTYTGNTITKVKASDIKLVDKNDPSVDLSNYLNVDKDGYVGISSDANAKLKNADDEKTLWVDLIQGVPETGCQNYDITPATQGARRIQTSNKLKVVARDLSTVNITIPAQSGSSNGKAITINPSTVTFTDKTTGEKLTLAEDVKIEVPENAKTKGTYTATISPKADNDNVTGKAAVSFNIVAADLSSATFTNENTIAGAKKQYTGEQITFTAKELGSLTLTDGNGKTTTIDPSLYDITFGENINAKAGKEDEGVIIIKGKGDFEGSEKRIYFDIVPASLDETNTKANKYVEIIDTKKYSDYAESMGIVVKAKNADKKEFTLKEGTDYTVEYSCDNNIKGGTVTAKITIINDSFKGGDTTKEVSSTITEKAIKDANIKLKGTDFTYTGKAIEPDFDVVIDGKIINPDLYEVSYTNNLNAGTATIKVTGKGDKYSDKASAKATFTIKPADASKLEGTLPSKSYKGYSLEVPVDEINVTLNGEKINVKDNFTVTYGENVEIGDGTVTLTPKNGNFTGTKTLTFKIVAELLRNGDLTFYDKNGVKVDDPEFDYDGTAHTFGKVVFSSTDTEHQNDVGDWDEYSKKLTEGTDYEIKYVDNVSGKDHYGAVLVVAKGKFGGAFEDDDLGIKGGVYTDAEGNKTANVIYAEDFYIHPQIIHENNISISNATYAGGLPVKPQVSIVVNGKTLVEGKDFEVITSLKDYDLKELDDEFTQYEIITLALNTDLANATTGNTLYAIIRGLNGYEVADNVAPYKWGINKFDLANADVTVNDGKVTVKCGRVDVETSEYTIESKDGKVTVTANKNSRNYTGSKTVSAVTEDQKPGTPMISSVKVVGNKATAILSGDTDGASGYDYVISTDRDCITNKDYDSVNKNQVQTSTTFKYVQQGTYYAYCHAWKRDENGKKVFSDWSNAYPFVVSAITPDAPVITNVKVSGSTIKVTYKAAANATGYDVVLGTASKKENGETRPYHYGDHKVLNLKEGTVTATFKNVPKGTWVVGMHAFNRTSEDGKKVFSPWSNLKKATVK